MPIIFLFLVTLMTPPASAINYFWCEKNDDCVKVYGGCGRYYSVHKRYKELYEAKAHKSDRVAFCRTPTQTDEKYKQSGEPRCHQKSCRLSLPKSSQ